MDSIGELLFSWGRHYLLVNNDLGSHYLLVNNDWGSHYFRGVIIYGYTGNREEISVEEIRRGKNKACCPKYLPLKRGQTQVKLGPKINISENYFWKNPG